MAKFPVDAPKSKVIKGSTRVLHLEVSVLNREFCGMILLLLMRKYKHDFVFSL